MWEGRLKERHSALIAMAMTRQTDVEATRMMRVQTTPRLLRWACERSHLNDKRGTV